MFIRCFIALVAPVLIFSANTSWAQDISLAWKSGCCSYHGGVCGCGGGRSIRCDGQFSPTCGCSYSPPPKQNTPARPSNTSSNGRPSTNSLRPTTTKPRPTTNKPNKPTLSTVKGFTGTYAGQLNLVDVKFNGTSVPISSLKPPPPLTLTVGLSVKDSGRSVIIRDNASGISYRLQYVGVGVATGAGDRVAGAIQSAELYCDGQSTLTMQGIGATIFVGLENRFDCNKGVVTFIYSGKWQLK